MAWSEKTNPKLFWRGSLTGAFHNDYTPWRQSQRERLIYLAAAETGFKDVLIETQVGDIELKEMSIKEMNKKWLDVAPTGGAVQVSECAVKTKLKQVWTDIPCHPQWSAFNQHR
jgi:hypothetical protein